MAMFQMMDGLIMVRSESKGYETKMAVSWELFVQLTSNFDRM